MANYRSFGFTKIVPRVPESSFAAVVEKSANAKTAVSLWNEVYTQSLLHASKLLTFTIVERPYLPACS